MSLLSKSKAKYIKTLQIKKSRVQESKFIVEGEKSVLEFLKSDYNIEEVVGTEKFFEGVDHQLLPSNISHCSEKTLSSLGSFKTNNSALAIVTIPKTETIHLEDDEVHLALDNINDPGNLGTIIRIADWYGINTILVSSNSVDLYNPKVVSASMGSLTRVNVILCSLQDVLEGYSGTVYAAELEGKPVNEVNKIAQGLILMGSESHGISDDLKQYVTQNITIPQIGRAESLNVAVATGIICNELLT